MTALDLLSNKIASFNKEPWNEKIGSNDFFIFQQWKKTQYKKWAITSVEKENQVKKEKTYIIQKGDSFRAIAKKNNVDFQTLLKLNNKSPESLILPGEKLLLPSTTIWTSANVNKAEMNNTVSNMQWRPEYLLMDNQVKWWEYFSEYAREQKQNICATYAYSRVADILRNQGKYFHMKEVNAWDIKNSRYLAQFDQKKLDSENLKSQLCSAPKGSMLTLRYNNTKHNKPWVSHVMVSLWNGKYTDLFWTQIRELDFNQFNFSQTWFNDGKHWYSFTEDARLIVPKLERFDNLKNKFYKVSNKSLSPNELANIVSKQTGLSIHYIKMNIAKENNISFADFNKRYFNLRLTVPVKDVSVLKLDMKQNNDEEGAKKFLDGLKKYKSDILSRYTSLTNYEYDQIAKRAMWILFQESDGGEHLRYKIKEGVHLLRLGTIFRPIATLFWKNIWEYSRGPTQIKFEGNIGKNQDLRMWLKQRGVSSWVDLGDVEKSALTTMVFLIEKYATYVRPLQNNEEWKNSTQKDINGNKVKRAPITYENSFDYLYYARNKPSEITKRTATPEDSIYIKQSNAFVDQYLKA